MVFLPLACGYLIAYIFRTINGSISDELIRQFSLDAGSLGLLTSIYFLAYTMSAIPIGIALDAFGPRRVQGWLMSVAAFGAFVFAVAPNETLLLVGRALIGIGAAGGLMAALKANALWVPRRYLPLANGGIVTFGGIGAIIATVPAAFVDADVGWRGTFLILAAVSLVVAVAVFVCLPRQKAIQDRRRGAGARGLVAVATDSRFLRLAPLSASVIGSAFAIQGLWAARWLVDVDRFGSGTVLDELLVMSIGLTIGGFVIGSAATWLGRVGIAETEIFAGLCLIFVGLQVALLLEVALPAALLWGLFGAFGAMSVLSYSLLDTMFVTTMVGRANSALNVLHLGAAWVIQAGMGVVIAQWPADPAGHYPFAAYQVGFALPVVVQIVGLFWFLGGSRCFRRALLVQAPAVRQVRKAG
jgi:predicted MFS family arabinose efflux permease